MMFNTKYTVLVVFLLISLSNATDYYVSLTGDDGNDGSINNPWKTIQNGSWSAHAGDTVYVRGGTYFEKVAFWESGTASAPIVFKPYPGELVNVRGTGVPNNDGSYTDDIFYLENVDFVTIEGFEISHVNIKEGSGIRLYGKSDGVKILNNKIHEIRGGSQDGGAMGITIYGSNNDNSIKNLIIDGNEIYDCDPAHSEALTLNGNVELFQVTNNIVHDVNNIGIDLIGGESWISSQYARNGIVSGNVVYNARSTYEDGYAAGIYVDGGKDIQIFNNEVYNCDLGIEIGAENKNARAQNILVQNNFIHDNDKGGIVFGGYARSKGRVILSRFTGNTLKNNDVLKTGVGEIWIQWANDNEVDNNKITPGSQNIMVYSEKGNVNTNIHHNQYCTLNGQWTWRKIWYEGLTSFQNGTSLGVGSTEQNGCL